jgi:hypothetical protein
MVNLVVFLALILSFSVAFHFARPRATRLLPGTNFNEGGMRLFLTMNDEDVEDKIRLHDYKGAYSIIRKNPMATLRFEDAQEILNNVDSLNPETGDVSHDSREVIEASAYVYRRLERQGILKGFGCVGGVYPEKSTEISPLKLERVTGLNVEAFTPRQRTTYWRLAGISFCFLQLLFGQKLGVDPLVTTIPASLALLVSDQIFLKGACFETVYQTLFPEYKENIIYHEAGHFFISYLLGVPVRGCVTNAWEARKYPDIRGQAGTIFYDNRLEEELNRQKISRTSLDRMTVVVMAGIAAEALKFGRAEGGAADEQTLISFFSSVSPPWNIVRVQGQARWGVLQAILLIKEHQAAYDALVEALREGRPVGDCIDVIEKNLPEILPAAVRRDEMEASRRRKDTDLLMRYVQKMTYSVGGVLVSSADTNTGSGDRQLIATAKSNDDGIANGNVEDVQDSINLFTEKIRKLSSAVESGQLDIHKAQSRGGGIWVNNLDAKKPIEDCSSSSGSGSGSTTTTTTQSPLGLSKPIEGYEERMVEKYGVEMRSSEDVKIRPTSVDIFGSTMLKVDNEVSVKMSSPNGVNLMLVENSDSESESESVSDEDMDPKQMLKSSRGYMMKKVELVETERQKRVEEMSSWIDQLKCAIEYKEKHKENVSK